MQVLAFPWSTLVFCIATVFPILQTSFTAAGCYLCPAPGSKGTKVLVCCSVDFSLPSKVELFHKLSDQANKQFFLPEVAQIIADGKSHVDHLVADASEVHFLDVTSSESVLLEAKRHNILSESTYRTVLSLQRNETNNFRSKTIELSDTELKNEVESVGSSVSEALKPGQIGYFMNRFLVKWEWTQKIALDAHSIAEATSDLNLGGERKGCYWSSCLMCHNKVAEVCLMVDAHWMYLAELSQGCHLENSEMQMEQLNGKITMCADYAQISAQRALVLLKTIPVAARRGLPVLVNSQGQLLCIPVSIPLFPFSFLLWADSMISLSMNHALRISSRWPWTRTHLLEMMSPRWYFLLGRLFGSLFFAAKSEIGKFLCIK